MQDNNSNNFIGVLLCGGKSTRMGSDKGLLFSKEQRWFEKNYNLLSKIFPKVVVSINSDQLDKYKEIKPNYEYIIDSADFIDGPLLGIISSHSKYPTNELFVLACDMIEMTETPIRNILSFYQNKVGYDFYLYQNETFLETLCGIYTVRGIEHLRERILEKDKNFAIHKLISSSKVFSIPVALEYIGMFINYNSLKVEDRL